MESLKNKILETLNEGLIDEIKFKTEKDGQDRFTIKAFYENDVAGELTIEILYGGYSYEFEDVFGEEEFYDIFKGSEIVKLENIKVDPYYGNEGLGSSLMERGMEKMKNDGYDKFYLNASPMGFEGLSKDNLVKFYKKFGFREHLDQGNNVIMVATF